MLCPTELFGITGYPLGHSMSPRLHNWGFAKVQHPAVFMPWPVLPEKVEDFIRAVRVLNIRGACVTIPHKEAVLPLLDRVSARALRMGAVNTLYWDGDVLCGKNTDVDGFLAPLLPLRPDGNAGAHAGRTLRSALVLGAGGAARAVVQGLKELGVPRIAICNRDVTKAQLLAQHFQVESLPWEMRHEQGADLLVNTTPLGMKGSAEEQTPFECHGFAACLAGGGGLAYDLVYNPLETRFLREAREAGLAVQDGLDMFVAQGLAQFTLWTGRDLPAHEARTVLQEALGK